LISTIVSEAIDLYKKTPEIAISFHYSAEAYFLFAALEAGKLQRVLSNVMKNSVDALDSKGSISVDLSPGASESVVITIRDNGRGIPPSVLPYIYDEGFTHGKEGGSGFGLSEARGYVEKWKGTISTTSSLGVGTTTSICLPKSNPPPWFVQGINISPTTTIVIVDDDDFIHSFIRDKIEQLCLNNPIRNLCTAAEFTSWINSQSELGKEVIYFFDLNLGSTIDGLDLISQYQLQSNAYLVSHRWDEEETRERCILLNIGLIPKGLLDLLPFKAAAKTITKYDAVVIDDDVSILTLLQEKAIREGKLILTLTSVMSFLKECQYISKDTDICIDSDLGTNTPGEIQAEMIYLEGFEHIYSTSVDSSLELKKFSWIKGLRKKLIPWKPYIDFKSS
jgi:hypothetical protein